MTTYEVVAMSVALGVVSVPIITWAVLWLIRRDRIFADLAPGEIPADPHEAPTAYVDHGAHYWGEIQARPTPPAGVSPGLGGVVIDGCADGRDIAAMILDLTRRGWLRLDRVDATATSGGKGSAGGDWAITRIDRPLDPTLDLNEVHLITNLATPGGTAWLSELCGASDNRLALVQQDLHREVVARGWYPAQPHQTSDIPMAVLGVGGLLGLVIALIDVSAVSVGAGAVIIACAFLTSVIVRGGTSRTALGTAVRIQVLGLRRYITDAQSYQFSYTDALETFRTYLPWAVVFELENQWADVFATLDVVAQTSELHFARDLGWFANIKDSGRALPPTAPVGAGSAPRRGAYCEEDVVATILMSPDELAAETRSIAAKVTITQARPDTRPGETVTPRGAAERIGPVVRRTASTLAGFWRRLRPADTEDTPRLGSPSPVSAEARPVPEDVPAAGLGAGDEKIPNVRQWVPKESRAARIQTQPKAAASTAPGLVAPASPVTPVRARPVEAPTTPARAPLPTQTSSQQESETEEPAVTVRRRRASAVLEPRSEATMFSGWMSEFDLAMTGDVEDRDVDTTDGGTVISGPQRFDVLLTPPLWPDVPISGSTPPAASVDLPQ